MKKTIPVCIIDLKEVKSNTNKEMLKELPQELLVNLLLIEIEKIDKAIEYIEHKKFIREQIVYRISYELNDKEVQELLSILKGEK